MTRSPFVADTPADDLSAARGIVRLAVLAGVCWGWAALVIWWVL